MRVGVGLPTTTPMTDARTVVEWARRAEDGPFTSLGVVDRLVYDSLDPLVALAAAAAVTSRLTLVTMVVVGPLRRTAVLAKQAASLNTLAGGRLVLGLSVGARAEDYDAAGVPTAERGRRFDHQLAELRAIWEDPRIGPHTPPRLLVGGTAAPSFLRAARYADGYVHGGGPPRALAGAVARLRTAWSEAGRPGQPEVWGQSYFTLCDPAAGEAYMRDYYAFTGAFVERIAADLLTTPGAIHDRIRGYAEAGCDELVLLPATADPEELTRLAEVVGELAEVVG